MLVFQVKDIFLQNLHPATTLAYLAVIVAGAVVLSHPLFLLALFISIFAVLVASGGMENWLQGGRFFFVLMAMLVLINTLVNNLGATVLLWGPVLPGLGRITVTLETLVFALIMGIRLITVFTAFMLYNLTINPDRALSLFARFFPRSALLMALTTKTIPYLSQKLQSAGEIAQCRGVNFHTGSRFSRIRNRLPLLRVLFMSSLEDSFNIGESIQARAYGSGPRTNYFQHSRRPGDILVMAASLFALLLIALSLILGWGGFAFYPRLDVMIVSMHQLVVLLGLFALLMLPFFAAWGWNKWNCLRWKI